MQHIMNAKKILEKLLIVIMGVLMISSIAVNVKQGLRELMNGEERPEISVKYNPGMIPFENIHDLKVEGQKPTEIVPFRSFGEQWHLWYYEDLKSRKPVRVHNEVNFR